MSNSEIDNLVAMLRNRPKGLGVEERRARYDALANLFPTAPDVAVERVIANGVKAEWTSTELADPSRVILYLHGGGYVFGSLDSHRHLVSELGRAAATRTLALDYRLAPECPFPAAVEDAVAGYRYLLHSGFQAARIAISGDSAGGGLAVALMIKLREIGLPQPACAVLMSPWVDMRGGGDSFKVNALRDPAVGKEIITFVAEQYLHDANPDSPLASPICAALEGIAPLTIYAGATETLLDDSIQLARAAGLADVQVHLEIWPRMVHIWPTYHQVLAEGRRAIAEAGRVIRDATATISPGQSSEVRKN
jgi:monoterpene epsilon-lactone hydrolase